MDGKNLVNAGITSLEEAIHRLMAGEVFYSSTGRNLKKKPALRSGLRPNTKELQLLLVENRHQKLDN